MAGVNHKKILILITTILYFLCGFIFYSKDSGITGAILGPLAILLALFLGLCVLGAVAILIFYTLFSLGLLVADLFINLKKLMKSAKRKYRGERKPRET